VRPLSPLELAFADAGLRTGTRHVYDCDSASWPFSAGTATAVGDALARCHGSDLLPLRLLFAHKPAVPLGGIAGDLEGARACLGPFPSRCECSLCPAFQRLWFGGCHSRPPPESPAPCWRTVATDYPLGNCDSLRTETSLSYLTRLGTVSDRSSPHSSVFRDTDGARTPPEELVNAASVARPEDRTQEGPSLPAWLRLSPVTWDYLRDVWRLPFVCFHPSLCFQ
jgi:hypothetical protein